MALCKFEEKDGSFVCPVCGMVAPIIHAVAKCDPERAKEQRGRAGTAGTELKKMLKSIGIVATPNCSCNSRAAMMDMRGDDWCELNIEMITDWLGEAAAERKLPFIRAAGRAMAKAAIRRSRRSK